MSLYIYLTIPILLATLWFYTAQIAGASTRHLRGKRICLLIAHPDDEAMFFSPTLLALTAPDFGNHIKILCLSTGLHFPRLYLKPISPDVHKLICFTNKETQTISAPLAARNCLFPRLSLAFAPPPTCSLSTPLNSLTA